MVRSALTCKLIPDHNLLRRRVNIELYNRTKGIFKWVPIIIVLSIFLIRDQVKITLKDEGFEHIKIHGLTLGVASIVEATRCGEGAT